MFILMSKFKMLLLLLIFCKETWQQSCLHRYSAAGRNQRVDLSGYSNHPFFPNLTNRRAAAPVVSAEIWLIFFSAAALTAKSIFSYRSNRRVTFKQTTKHDHHVSGLQSVQIQSNHYPPDSDHTGYVLQLQATSARY